MNMIGPTEAIMKDIGSRISFMDAVYINGKTVVHMKEYGKTIKCTEKVYTPGRMVVNTTGNTAMIRNTGTANTLMLMEASIKGSGLTVYSMAKQNI